LPILGPLVARDATPWHGSDGSDQKRPATGYL
jgi:hypothetical protein